MKRLIGAMMALSCTAWAAPAAAQTVDIRTPKAFEAALRSAGVQPGPMHLVESGEAPAWNVKLDGFDTTIFLWGCEQRRNCLYISFEGYFRDTTRMPSDSWLLKQSDHFSTTKVGHSPAVGTDLRILVGQIGQGMPIEQLKFMITDWKEDVAYLRSQLQADGYLAPRRGAGGLSD